MSGNNLVGQTLKGHYEITEELGSGTFGETYLAINTEKFNDPCVVKRLKPQHPSLIQWVQQKFEEEAKTLKLLGKHPQIPELFAHFQENQDFFLVQEYIKGDDLRTQFVSGVPWPENIVIFLLRDILEVLEIVHKNNVIHRDIKPENIRITEQDNKIVLIDFGAVKQITTQIFNSQGQVTKTTVVIGTPGYMPMEQMKANPMLCSDVYAVGMIGIEALTGIFPANIPMDSTGKPEWRNKAQVSNEFAAVLDKMVCLYTRDRYQSASEALEAVRKLIESTTPPPVQPGGTTPTVIASPPPPLPTPQPPPPPTQYAGFSTRLMADMIDKTILIFGSIIWDLITQTPTNDGAEFLGRFIATYVILGFLYCPIMDSSKFQGTIGKKVLGIAVTDINGNQLTFEQATKRHSSKFLSYLTCLIGFFLAGWTGKKQALHDKICETLVVRK